jgi:hypothetical protein
VKTVRPKAAPICDTYQDRQNELLIAETAAVRTAWRAGSKTVIDGLPASSAALLALLPASLRAAVLARFGVGPAKGVGTGVGTNYDAEPERAVERSCIQPRTQNDPFVRSLSCIAEQPRLRQQSRCSTPPPCLAGPRVPASVHHEPLAAGCINTQEELAPRHHHSARRWA